MAKSHKSDKVSRSTAGRAFAIANDAENKPAPNEFTLGIEKNIIDDILSNYTERKIKDDLLLEQRIKLNAFKRHFSNSAMESMTVMAELDLFIMENPGVPISGELRDIINDALKEKYISKGFYLEIPKVAPALWLNDKMAIDTPATFIQRHYSPWLRQGLHKGHIKQLDPTLYMALYRWEQKPDRIIPPGFALPGRSEIVAQADAEMTEEELKHAQRVVSRRQRQRARLRNENDL